MDSFVTFRRNTGFDVTMFSTDVTGKTKQQIRSFIQAQYVDVKTRPSYLFLVGDVDEIPFWSRSVCRRCKDERLDNGPWLCRSSRSKSCSSYGIWSFSRNDNNYTSPLTPLNFPNVKWFFC
jgi:hypothetical protein